MRESSNLFKRHPVWTGIILFFALFFILSLLGDDILNETDTLLSGNETDTFNSENYGAPSLYEKPKSINLTFYDNFTNCSLDGDIYVDEFFFGTTKEGKYLLTEKEYNEKFKENSTLFMVGETDNCFGEDSNLPFASAWIVFELSQYFGTEEAVSFEAEINPRWPTYYAAIQGFVRPNEINLQSISLEENLSNKEIVLGLFSQFYMSYTTDLARFGKQEYWQTPKDLTKNKAGDCEDWAVTMVSMVEAYDPSIDCYLAGWDTHINMICNFNNKTMGMFDQDKISTFNSIDKNLDGDSAITQENTISVRKWLGNYFNNYGLSSNERTLYYLINSKEIIIFESREDFVNWVVEKEKII